jgi:hypothetical protein
MSQIVKNADAESTFLHRAERRVKVIVPERGVRTE